MTKQANDIAMLDAASWPVLLVDGSACVRRANAAAIDVFGAKVESDPAPLSGLWTNENEGDPAAFLHKVDSAKALVVPLKLRGKGIAITPFNASVCILEREGTRFFLFQLFPVSAAQGGG